MFEGRLYPVFQPSMVWATQQDTHQQRIQAPRRQNLNYGLLPLPLFLRPPPDWVQTLLLMLLSVGGPSTSVIRGTLCNVDWSGSNRLAQITGQTSASRWCEARLRDDLRSTSKCKITPWSSDCSPPRLSLQMIVHLRTCSFGRSGAIGCKKKAAPQSVTAFKTQSLSNRLWVDKWGGKVCLSAERKSAVHVSIN